MHLRGIVFVLVIGIAALTHPSPAPAQSMGEAPTPTSPVEVQNAAWVDWKDQNTAVIRFTGANITYWLVERVRGGERRVITQSAVWVPEGETGDFEIEIPPQPRDVAFEPFPGDIYWVTIWGPGPWPQPPTMTLPTWPLAYKPKPTAIPTPPPVITPTPEPRRLYLPVAVKGQSLVR